MEYGYRLKVYKADRRCKGGERFVKQYDYTGYDSRFMMEEVQDLHRQLYPKSAGWRLEFQPLTAMVKSLMSGQMVEIPYEDRGGPCDPSTERYWSM